MYKMLMGAKVPTGIIDVFFQEETSTYSAEFYTPEGDMVKTEFFLDLRTCLEYAFGDMEIEDVEVLDDHITNPFDNKEAVELLEVGTCDSL